MAKQFKITTTGTPTGFNVSGRRIVHPETDLDLIPEFCYIEIVRDSGFQDAIDSGKMTVKDEDGTTITNIRDQFTPHANSSVFTNTLNDAIKRLSEWNPPCLGEYTVGSGATLTLTSDAHGYKFGLENAQVDTFHRNHCLYDNVSLLHYDASTMEVFVHYYVESGYTISSKGVVLECNYNFVVEEEDFETGGVTTLSKTIDIDGITANELNTVSIGNISGVDLAKMLKMNFRRQGNAGADTFEGEFFIVGYMFDKI